MPLRNSLDFRTPLLSAISACSAKIPGPIRKIDRGISASSKSNGGMTATVRMRWVGG